MAGRNSLPQGRRTESASLYLYWEHIKLLFPTDSFQIMPGNALIDCQDPVAQTVFNGLSGTKETNHHRYFRCKNGLGFTLFSNTNDFIKAGDRHHFSPTGDIVKCNLIWDKWWFSASLWTMNSSRPHSLVFRIKDGSVCKSHLKISAAPLEGGIIACDIAYEKIFCIERVFWEGREVLQTSHLGFTSSAPCIHSPNASFAISHTDTLATW